MNLIQHTFTNTEIFGLIVVCFFSSIRRSLCLTFQYKMDELNEIGIDLYDADGTTRTELYSTSRKLNGVS